MNREHKQAIRISSSELGSGLLVVWDSHKRGYGQPAYAQARRAVNFRVALMVSVSLLSLNEKLVSSKGHYLTCIACTQCY